MDFWYNAQVTVSYAAYHTNIILQCPSADGPLAPTVLQKGASLIIAPRVLAFKRSQAPVVRLLGY